MAAERTLREPASPEFIKWLHREFYADATQKTLTVAGKHSKFVVTPGQWRSRPEHDVVVGRHVPPSSEKVESFIAYFEDCYRLEHLGKASRIMAIASSHHRFSYIHPFPDGNGRVGRLVSHAMADKAGIGAHGLWSISRGLARGIEDRTEYKSMLDLADSPRRGDLDGRGNLSLQARVEFTEWFLRVCLDQVRVMSGLFDLDNLSTRLSRYVQHSDTLRPEAARLLQEALSRGQFERGEASRITGLPERTARRLLNQVLGKGLLASNSPKTPVSLRFPMDAREALLPKLYSGS